MIFTLLEIGALMIGGWIAKDAMKERGYPWADAWREAVIIVLVFVVLIEIARIGTGNAWYLPVGFLGSLDRATARGIGQAIAGLLIFGIPVAFAAFWTWRRK